jgi:hypothetical protein
MFGAWEHDDMRFARFALLWPALLACLLAGCATGPKIHWNDRIGNYTYDQSVKELGVPDKSAKQDDGGLVAEWLVRSYAPQTLQNGGGVYTGQPDYVAPEIVSVYPGGPDAGQWLRLTFAPDGKLVSWKRYVER